MRTASLLLLLTSSVFAESRGAVDLKGSIGYTGFIDEANHLQTGGSARFYISPRFSVEPEFQYLRGANGHYDTVLIPNVNWDFRASGRVIPYVTGGVGWIRTAERTRFFNFNHNQTFVQVGAGVKLRLNDRWYVAPEFRLGSELHARTNVAIGYTFGR